uniref:C2 domain-containing protein n=1 Tax=Caenorhabditis japonica TaxID=281687 RepID=A0A8R1EGH8_CAEJA
MSAQVVGTDRTYGFPRICDQSPSVRIFPEEHKKIIAHLEKEKPTGKPGQPVDSLKIKVRGKCFNATMTVVKHTERCPWCPDPKEITIIGQEPHGETHGLRAGSSAWLFGSPSSLISDDRIVHIGVLVLAIVAVLASTAFAIILVMYLRNKRLVKETLKKPRFHPYISVKGQEIAEDNN